MTEQVSNTEQQKTETADMVESADSGGQTFVRLVKTWSGYHNGPIFSEKWGSVHFSSTVTSLAVSGEGLIYSKTSAIDHRREVLRLNFKRK